MKNISCSIAALLLFMLVSCSDNNKSQNSEIIQHPTVNKNLSDGNKANQGVEVSEEGIKTVFVAQKSVYEAPQKSIQELSKEIVQLEEQGGANENDAKIYYTYGEALVDMKKYDEAIEMYQEAEKRKYKDLKTLYFKIARVYALQGLYYGSMADYLISARKAGFEHYNALLSDVAFKNWRAEYDFMYLYKELFGKDKKAMFKAFVALAPQKDLSIEYVLSPVELLENTNYNYREQNGYYEQNTSINSHFEAFVTGVSDDMFSREGGDNYRYELLLEAKEQYVAVIYSVEQPWSAFILPKKYHLVTYDLDGNKISELELAERGSLKTCKGFVLYPNQGLVVTTYQLEWKKGAKERLSSSEQYLNYKNLKSSTAILAQAYQITETGRIVEMEDLLVVSNPY